MIIGIIALIGGLIGAPILWAINTEITALWFGLSGLLILLLLVTGIILFEIKSKVFRTDEWKWVAQITASAFTILMGFQLYFVQQGIGHWTQRSSMKKAVFQELVLIREQLDSINDQAEICTPETAQPGLMVNAYLLPDIAITKAIDSLIFPSNYTNHLMRLKYNLDDHNRWADFGFKILTDPENPNAFVFAEAQQNWIQIDQHLYTKVIQLIECIETGSSPSTGDKDCI